MKKPFQALWEIFTFRSKRLTLSLAVFGITAWLVHGGHLSDAAYVGVVPVILTHFYLTHKEKLAGISNANDPVTKIETVVNNVRGQL